MRGSLGKRLGVIPSVEHYFYILDGHNCVWVKWAVKVKAVVVQAKREWNLGSAGAPRVAKHEDANSCSCTEGGTNHS